MYGSVCLQFGITRQLARRMEGVIYLLAVVELDCEVLTVQLVVLYIFIFIHHIRRIDKLMNRKYR